MTKTISDLLERVDAIKDQLQEIREADVLIEHRDDGTTLMGGFRFSPFRRPKFPIAKLPRSFDFIAGLEFALGHQSSPTREEVAADHRYGKSWVGDILRRLQGMMPEQKGEPGGLTVETVVMLRESIPALDHWMRQESIAWPKIADIVDYKERRAGVQTDERLEDQRKRRGL